MPDIENTVDVTLPEAVDDAQQNEGESLSNIAEETQEEQPQKDAGWFRQRIDKAKAQAIADYKAQHDTEVAELRAEIEELRAERLERKAQELVDGFQEDLNVHGIAGVAEIYDGDPPYMPHGAINSALSVSEIIRVKYLINQYKKEESL